MNKEIPQYIEAVHNFQEDRPVMKEANDTGFMVDHLVGEAEEVKEAYESFQNGETNHDHFKDELCDVIQDAFTLLLKENDWDEKKTVEDIFGKLGYNMAQYPAGMFQEGEYEEQIELAKEDVKKFKLDDAYYGNGHNNGSQRKVVYEKI